MTSVLQNRYPITVYSYFIELYIQHFLGPVQLFLLFTLLHHMIYSIFLYDLKHFQTHFTLV